MNLHLPMDANEALGVHLVPRSVRDRLENEVELLQPGLNQQVSFSDLLKQYRESCLPTAQIVMPAVTLSGMDQKIYSSGFYQYILASNQEKSIYGGDAFAMIARYLSQEALGLKDLTLCVMSIWSLILPQTAFETSFLKAAQGCDWHMEPITYEAFRQGLERHGRAHILTGDITHFSIEVAYCYAVLIGLLFTKQLTSANYSEWFRRRILSCRTKLGLTQDSADWMETHKPLPANCESISTRFGSKIFMRRQFYHLLQSWKRRNDESVENSLSEVALAVTRYTDMTHIHFIIRYLLQVAPGILGSPHIRPEVEDLTAVIAQLSVLGTAAPWARMILKSGDIPELQRARLKITSHLAVKLATRDNPSLQYYAPTLSNEFARASEELEREFSAIRPAIPRDGIVHINREYHPLQAKLVISSLQPELTVAKTAIREIRDAENESVG